MEGTSACPAITQLHTCPPLMADVGSQPSCFVYYTNVLLGVTLFSEYFDHLEHASRKKLKPVCFHGFFYVIHRLQNVYFATFSAKCMDLLQHRCSEPEYHCLTHTGFQYELTKCALICPE